MYLSKYSVFKGRIPEILLLNYFNKTKDIASIHAMNIADIRNVSD